MRQRVHLRDRARAFVTLAMLGGAFAMPSATFADATSAPASPAVPAYGTNLVKNGDAEAEPGSKSSDTVVKPSSWTTTGEFTSIQYGTGGGFPDAKSPGPDDRGVSLFEGGNTPLSTAKQSIALDSFATDIDTGAVKYQFSAWLGGFSGQEDRATVSVDFKGASGAALGHVTIGPVTAADRKSLTGSLQKSADGTVPKGARSAVVTMTITRKEGRYNDGSVDDIVLKLAKG